MYDRHPSTLLRNTFIKKAFQGAPPEKAIYLFLGLDANYSETIEQSPIFRDLLEYHEDGPAFWRKHGVHHPFLLPGYRGDGHRYHRTFAGIGFRPEHAAIVSFAEILHIPTFGRNNLTVADLDWRHLAHLNRAILEGEAKHIFIPGCVAKLMRASGCFPWLPVEPKDEGLPLKVWFRSGERAIYWHYHLSVYGAHKAKQEAQLRQISTLITADGGDHTESAITTCASVRVEGLLQSEDIAETQGPAQRLSELLLQAVRPITLKVFGMYTDPRTWGVYEVPTATGKNFRFGNHPVRGAELAQNHESVKVIAILPGRALARELASLLNDKKRG